MATRKETVSQMVIQLSITDEDMGLYFVVKERAQDLLKNKKDLKPTEVEKAIEQATDELREAFIYLNGTAIMNSIISESKF